MSNRSAEAIRRANTVSFPPLHAEQRRLYDNRTGRDVWRAGRRFGKTTELEVIAANCAMKGKRIGWFCPTYKLLLPSYKRILRMIKPIVETHSKVDSLITTERGGEVEFWTLGDEDAGRSRWYDGAIVDEASLVKKGLKETWQKSIAPTLLDRQGWAIVAGTPKGIDPDNFFYEVCTDAKNSPHNGGKSEMGFTEFHVPTRMNPMLDPAAVANLVNEYPPLVYQQEFLADFIDWTGAAFFSLTSLLDNGRGVPMPTRCDSVFAIVDTATKTGKENDGTAVIYFAKSRLAPEVTILDYDIVQIEGALLETWLPGVFKHLEHLAVRCGARAGSLGALIEDKSSGMVLIQQALRRGWPAQAIDSALTAMGKDERAISVSGYVYQGRVKLSQEANDKIVTYKQQTRNHLITQVTGYRVGTKDPKAQDDILDCFCYGVAVALGDEEGF